MKRILKWSFISLGILLLLLVGGWYGFCYWVNSWRNTEPPACHESWSEQQAADLQEIDNELRNNSGIAGLTLFCEGELAPTTKWLRERKWGMLPAMLLGWRELCMPAREALHETMRTGKGDVLLPSGIPVADLALKCHKTALLQELIRRGADPNHAYIPWTAPVQATQGGQSTLFWETFEGLHLNFVDHLAPDTRIELLEFMLAHGASLSYMPNKQLAELYVLYPLATDTTDKGRATAWALRHGMPMSEESKQNCVHFLQKTNSELLLQLQAEVLLPTP